MLTVENKSERNFHWALVFCSFIIGAYSYWFIFGLIPLLIIILNGIKSGAFYFEKNYLQWGWIFFYLLYSISAFYYWNPVTSPQRFEYKLSWLILPILFSFKPRFPIQLKYPIIGLASGVFIASLIGVAKAIYTYSTTQLKFTAFTSSYVCIIHPTYYSAYATIAIIGLIIGIYYDKTIPKNYLFYLFVGTTLIMILLAMSLAAILFLMLATALFTLRYIYKRWSVLRATVITCVLILSASIGLTQISFLRGDVNNSLHAIQKYISSPSDFIHGKPGYLSGDDVRLVMWTVSAMELYQHPFGVGTTRIDSFLSNRLQQYGQFYLAEKDALGQIRYNPHNQYLQMGLELGIIPLVLFILYLIILFYFGIKKKNYWLLTMLSVLMFNCLFESVLQTQSGIVGFTFLITLSVLYQSTEGSDTTQIETGKHEME